MTGEEPARVNASANIGAVTGVDEALVGTLEFPSGVIGHFECGLRAYRQHSYTLKGSAGMIVVPTSFVPDKDADTMVQHWQGDDYMEYVISATDHYQLMVEDFADALLEGRAPRFAPSDAGKQHACCGRAVGAGALRRHAGQYTLTSLHAPERRINTVKQQ